MDTSSEVQRIWVDSLEQDPAYPSCSSITGGGYNGPEVDGGVTLPQLKSNVPKELSPNILEDDLATLVPNKGIKLPTTILVELEEEDLVYQCYDEDSSQSDECASEGAGIDKEKTFQLDVNVPIGFVCHNCEMYAIVGMRYRCKDCWEKWHTFELIASDGDSSVPEVLKRDLNSQSDGEDNLMSEGERRSQSDECGPEGA
ncbi:hypothetical protein FRX31_005822, partial [Thalictrum thalictroides]